MRGRLVTAACGLVLAAALGIPAAQARAGSTVAAPGASAITNCSPIYSVGHKSSTGNETWSYVGSDTNLYFYSSGPRASFCFDYEYPGLNGLPVGLVKDQSNGECLVGISVGARMRVAPCSSNGFPDEWSLLPVDTTASYVWALQNYDVANQCLYENTQEPAIWTSCGASYTDRFEWFYWPVSY